MAIKYNLKERLFFLAVAFSIYLMVTLPVSTAQSVSTTINLNIFGPDGATRLLPNALQIAAPSSMVNKQIKVQDKSQAQDFTDMRVVVSINPQPGFIIGDVFLIPCADEKFQLQDVTDCIRSVQRNQKPPIKFSTFVDYQANWLDMSNAKAVGEQNYGEQEARLLSLVNIEIKGKRQWFGYWDVIKRSSLSDFTVIQGNDLESADLVLSDPKILNLTTAFIEKTQTIPKNWISRVVLGKVKGQSAQISTVHLLGLDQTDAPEKFAVQKTDRTNVIDTAAVSKEFGLVFPGTVNIGANSLTIAPKPQATCGNDAIDADAGETRQNCCRDFPDGCGDADLICGVDRANKNDPGLCINKTQTAAIAHFDETEFLSCERRHPIKVGFEIFNMPVGSQVQEVRVELNTKLKQEKPRSFLIAGCEKLTDTNAQNNCWTDAASNQKDVLLCERIEDKNKKDLCLKEVDKAKSEPKPKGYPKQSVPLTGCKSVGGKTECDFKLDRLKTCRLGVFDIKNNNLFVNVKLSDQKTIELKADLEDLSVSQETKSISEITRNTRAQFEKIFTDLEDGIQDAKKLLDECVDIIKSSILLGYVTASIAALGAVVQIVAAGVSIVQAARGVGGDAAKPEVVQRGTDGSVTVKYPDGSTKSFTPQEAARAAGTPEGVGYPQSQPSISNPQQRDWVLAPQEGGGFDKDGARSSTGGYGYLQVANRVRGDGSLSSSGDSIKTVGGQTIPISDIAINRGSTLPAELVPQPIPVSAEPQKITRDYGLEAHLYDYLKNPKTLKSPTFFSTKQQSTSLSYSSFATKSSLRFQDKPKEEAKPPQLDAFKQTINIGTSASQSALQGATSGLGQTVSSFVGGVGQVSQAGLEICKVAELLMNIHTKMAEALTRHQQFKLCIDLSLNRLGNGDCNGGDPDNPQQAISAADSCVSALVSCNTHLEQMSSSLTGLGNYVDQKTQDFAKKGGALQGGRVGFGITAFDGTVGKEGQEYPNTREVCSRDMVKISMDPGTPLICGPGWDIKVKKDHASAGGSTAQINNHVSTIDGKINVLQTTANKLPGGTSEPKTEEEKTSNKNFISTTLNAIKTSAGIVKDVAKSNAAISTAADELVRLVDNSINSVVSILTYQDLTNTLSQMSVQLARIKAATSPEALQIGESSLRGDSGIVNPIYQNAGSIFNAGSGIYTFTLNCPKSGGTAANQFRVNFEEEPCDGVKSHRGLPTTRSVTPSGGISAGGQGAPKPEDIVKNTVLAQEQISLGAGIQKDTQALFNPTSDALRKYGLESIQIAQVSDDVAKDNAVLDVKVIEPPYGVLRVFGITLKEGFKGKVDHAIITVKIPNAEVTKGEALGQTIRALKIFNVDAAPVGQVNIIINHFASGVDAKFILGTGEFSKSSADTFFVIQSKAPVGDAGTKTESKPTLDTDTDDDATEQERQAKQVNFNLFPEKLNIESGIDFRFKIEVLDGFYSGQLVNIEAAIDGQEYRIIYSNQITSNMLAAVFKYNDYYGAPKTAKLKIRVSNPTTKRFLEKSIDVMVLANRENYIENAKLEIKIGYSGLNNYLFTYSRASGKGVWKVNAYAGGQQNKYETLLNNKELKSGLQDILSQSGSWSDWTRGRFVYEEDGSQYILAGPLNLNAPGDKTLDPIVDTLIRYAETRGSRQ